MKSKKEMVYDYMVTTYKNGQEKNLKFSTTELAKELSMQRSNLSTILNELSNEKRVKKFSGRPVLYQLINIPSNIHQEESCFSKLIGHDGSLQNAIRLAKAAILYPKHSLPTLLLGSAGSEKSDFAKMMYEFAKEESVIESDAPFVVLNCHYFGTDSKMDITASLLGDTKKPGILYQAIGGVLYINHIDFLSSNERSALFGILEHKTQTLANTIIIFSARDSVNGSFQNEIVSKFPVKINLPLLQTRGLSERFELIKTYFNNEVSKMNRDIHIDAELLRCVLLYPCEGNLKQLKSDIRIGCANAYVRELNMKTDKLHIYINDFPGYVRKGFLFYKENREEIEQLIPKNYSYIFSNMQMEKLKDNLNKPISHSVYDTIDQKVIELRASGITEEEINTIIGDDIENDIKKFSKHIVSEDVNKETMSKIVDNGIIQLVDDFLNEAGRHFSRVYSASTFYGLCLHLSAALERTNHRQRLSNSKIMEIIENNKNEYDFCMDAVLQWENRFNISIPIEEAIFITMFICNEDNIAQPSKKPVVLIVMHGNSGATSIAEVVNDLVKENNTYAYDLPLDKSLENAYEELKSKVKEINQGKGVLLVYDMGSLKMMGETIMHETGINIRMLEIPVTLIALECARKVSGVISLDEAYDSVIESYTGVNKTYQRKLQKSIIITLCMSGEGSAIQIKQYLEKHLNNDEIDILAFAISDKEYLINELNKLKKEHYIPVSYNI